MNATVAIALDLGTTSIKAGLLGQNGKLGNIVSLASPKIIVDGGRYESNALAYAEISRQALQECMEQASGCRTLGLCSQRSSFLIWERASGQPITPLISWQDNRGISSCVEMRMHENLILERSGLPLTPYYFAPKLRVVLRDNPELKKLLLQGKLLVGMLDTFLIWHWTGGRHFVTDASMAARTLLMDTGKKQWSPVLCELFSIPAQILPQIISSARISLQLETGLLLQASVGDQSAALLAGIAEDSGEAMVNLGTGCFVVRYLPPDKTASKGYLRTLVYQDGGQQAHFAVEGTLNSIAAALAPYPVSECVFDDFARDDVFCVAEPSGLGAPYFRSDIGLCFSEPILHLSQKRVAVLLLEAIVFRVARILEDFHRDSPLSRVYLSGGLSELTCLQQGIALCAPFEVYNLSQGESSLQGAAMLAAGMAPACGRRAARVSVADNTRYLPEKYRRWKEWLDRLCLNASE